jgi:predicted DNA-binding transcriptional regulator AlpA
MADQVDRLLRTPEVRRAVGGVSRVTLHKWVMCGKFPPPVKVGLRNCWRESVVEAWIDGRPTATNLVRAPFAQGTAHAPVL